MFEQEDSKCSLGFALGLQSEASVEPQSGAAGKGRLRPSESCELELWGLWAP